MLVMDALLIRKSGRLIAREKVTGEVLAELREEIDEKSNWSGLWGVRGQEKMTGQDMLRQERMRKD